MSGTPPPEKPRIDEPDNSGDGMPRVVASAGGTLELPMLTKANYHEWALVMQVNLEALGLWRAMEASNVERREVRLALAAILRVVPTEMRSGLAVKSSAKEAWAAVKTMRMGDKGVRDANAQRLLREFENVAFRSGETIDEFALRLNSLVCQLRELGEKVEEERVVKKLLRVVPAKYGQVAVSIEMLLDLNSMSLEELVGRLRVAEERSTVEEVADGVERLLLTEEQWEARRWQRGKVRAHGGDRRGGDDKKDGARSDDRDDNSSTVSGMSRRGKSRYRGRCFECGERGHMARDCRVKKKEKALLVDVDEEPALL